MLATLALPVRLGDLPDMTGAARRMLNPRQIPSPEVLTQLNGQLAAFVAPHANLIYYDVCAGSDSGCDESGILAALDQVILDGVRCNQLLYRWHGQRSLAQPGGPGDVGGA